MPPHQVVVFIIGTVVVLFAAYYVTYYVGMKASGRTRAGSNNRNISILENFSIARDKSFCIVEVAGKVYVVGITSNSMTVLDTYELQEYEELAVQSGDGAQMPWADTPVGRYGNKLTRTVVAYFAKRMGKLPKDDDINEELGIRNEELGIKGKKADKSTGKKQNFAESMKDAERKASEDD